MRIRNSTACASIKTSESRRPVAASSGGFAAGFLTLPTVSQKVPIKSVSREGDKMWLQIAVLCAELVEDDELVITNKTTAREIVSQALSVWASKHCADINMLDSFELVASLDRDAFCLDGEESESKQPVFFVGLQSRQMTPYINVKAKVEALEKLHPGLGRTAIAIAEQAGYRTFTAFSPEVAHYQCQNLYWYGADNDEDFKEEMGNCGEGEMGEEVLLPSQFAKAFPDYFFTGECKERDALQQLMAQDDAAGETAKAILSIMDLIDQDARLPDLTGYCVEQAFFSCYMGVGGEADMLARVLDDFYESTSRGEGHTDLYGIAEVEFNMKAFQKWRDGMEKGFALYTQLDRLMNLIGDL